MKLWKTTFVLLTVAVLPFALVAVGDAQQLTCWYLKPAENETLEPIGYTSPNPDGRNKDLETNLTTCEDADTLSCMVLGEEAH